MDKKCELKTLAEYLRKRLRKKERRMKNNIMKLGYLALLALVMPGCSSTEQTTKPESGSSETEKDEGKEEQTEIKPILSSDGKTIEYGIYPQNNVNDASLLEKLNQLTKPESNGFYLLDDEYYAKTEAKPFSYAYNFDNGDAIVDQKEYWFKCSPIVWNVLSHTNNEYFIASSVLLDSRSYHSSTEERTIDEKTVTANNYKHSDIRAWLNDEFYNSAFALGNKNILTTKVDNSPSSIDSGTNPYCCEDTNDKIFLLSYQDYINSDYGFAATSQITETRYFKTTDWCRAKGAIYSTSSYYQYNGYYWTRSPSKDAATYVRSISFGGDFAEGPVDKNIGCVCPALKVTIN